MSKHQIQLGSRKYILNSAVLAKIYTNSAKFTYKKSENPALFTDILYRAKFTRQL